MERSTGGVALLTGEPGDPSVIASFIVSRRALSPAIAWERRKTQRSFSPVQRHAGGKESLGAQVVRPKRKS
jgi:hypothetical protein